MGIFNVCHSGSSLMSSMHASLNSIQMLLKLSSKIFNELIDYNKIEPVTHIGLGIVRLIRIP